MVIIKGKLSETSRRQRLEIIAIRKWLISLHTVIITKRRYYPRLTTIIITKRKWAISLSTGIITKRHYHLAVTTTAHLAIVTKQPVRSSPCGRGIFMASNERYPLVLL